MNCKSVQNRLSAYLDRELGGDELLVLRAHLSTCRECREELDGLRALKSLLGGVPCPEPPDDLSDKLTASMLKLRYEEPRKLFKVSAFMFAGVAACSMLGTLVALNYNLNRSGRENSAMGMGNMANASRMDLPTYADSHVSPIISASNFGPR